MKAVLCRSHGLPDTLEVADLPTPEPGPAQVRIGVRAAGVNFPDTLIIQNKYQFKPPLPFSPGGEVAGTIEAVGADVKNLAVGQDVIAFTGWGGFAEQVVADAIKVIPMPPGVPYDVASSFVMTYGTSYHALKDRAALASGETLLVLGAAGGVGLAAVELGRALGARVDRGRVERREARRLPRARRRRDDQLRDRGPARARQGADRRARRRRRLRPGRRHLLRACAAQHRVARPLPRRRLRERRDPEHPAQPRAAEGLLDRRRVLGRVRTSRARWRTRAIWRRSSA